MKGDWHSRVTESRSLVAVAVLLVSASCTVFRAGPDADPSHAGDTTPSADRLLAQAEENLAEGNLPAATSSLERLVDTYPDTPEAPRALFQLAALQWNPASTDYDPAAAIGRLRQVVSDYPHSPWTPAAKAILALDRSNAGLRRTLAELQAQIDELKQLDLGPRG